MEQITIKKSKKVCVNCGAELPDTSEEVAKFINFKLLEENKILNNILKRIKDSCENIKQVDDCIRIKLIEEILEDKYDIHYFLEREENEELKNAISSNLSTYQDCIHSAQDDIATGILNRNATDNEFCKHVIYETRNQLNSHKRKLKKIKELFKQADLTQCNRCDGIGIDSGCQDKDCSTYILSKILEVIEE